MTFSGAKQKIEDALRDWPIDDEELVSEFLCCCAPIQGFAWRGLHAR
jgi:hypothetical protein